MSSSAVNNRGGSSYRGRGSVWRTSCAPNFTSRNQRASGSGYDVDTSNDEFLALGIQETRNNSFRGRFSNDGYIQVGRHSVIPSTSITGSSDHDNGRLPDDLGRGCSHIRGQRRSRDGLVTLSLGSFLGAAPHSQSRPLTSFAPFSRLPTELRFAIWKIAANEPRLIEIKRGPYEEDETDFNAYLCHYGVRVAAKSHQTPAVLRTCKEARETTLHLFQFRLFDCFNHGDSDRKRWTIYNPDADILYFAADKHSTQHACLSTIHGLSKRMRGMEVPRIAIGMTGRVTNCCSLDDHGYGAGYGRNGGAGLMQVLHGIDPELCNNQNNFPGFKGLKKIYFVVPSNLWPAKQGEVDFSTGFRPAIHNGLTSGQQGFKHQIDSQEQDIIDNGAPWGVGHNNVKWSGEEKPAIEFVSLVKKVRGDKFHVYDALPLSRGDVNRLFQDKWFQDFKSRSGCTVFIPKGDGGEQQREVGFVGPKRAVARAKQDILNKLSADGNNYQGVVRMAGRY